MMVDDIDFIDDILLPKKPTTVQALGKFRPKARSKANKGVSLPSQTSKVVHADSSNLDSSCNANAPAKGLSLPSSCVIDSFDATLNQNNNEKNVAVTNGMASEVLASIDSNLSFNVEDMRKDGYVVVRLASDDNLVQPTTVTVAEKSDNVETIKESVTELDISPSELHNSQDPLLPECSIVAEKLDNAEIVKIVPLN